ncbi:MAG: O-antigen ligase family protein [Ignavibacteriales bacterium]|nr:O-antigen ligase family protein [Ignavibacteriales bacterium]
MFFSVNLTESIFDLSKLFLLIILVFIFYSLINKYNILLLFKIVTITSFILSIFTFYLLLEPIFHTSKLGFDIYSIFATMGHKNILSIFLLLSLPLAIYFFLNTKKSWKYFSLTTITFIIINIIILQSRSVWLALFISTFLTTILFLINNKKSFHPFTYFKKHRSLSFLFFSLIFSLFILFLFTPLNNIFISKSFSTSPQGRVDLYEQSLNMFYDNPITGVGIGNWKINFPKYSFSGLEDQFNEIHFIRPHNDYLWVLSETGIFGFLSYLSIFILAFYLLIKNQKYQENKSLQQLMYLIFFGLTSFIIDSLFSFPKERIEILILLSLFLSLIIKFSYKQNKINSKTVSYFFIFILLSIFIFSTNRFLAEIHTKNALDAKAVNNHQLVIQEISTAESFFYNIDHVANPISWYSGNAKFLSGDINSALHEYLKAYSAHPYHFHNLNNIGTCYSQLNDNINAIKYFKKALTIYPYSQNTLLNLVISYYNIGKLDSAKYYFENNYYDTSSERYHSIKEQLYFSFDSLK